MNYLQLARIAGGFSNILWVKAVQYIPISQAFTIMSINPLVLIIMFRIFFGYEITLLDLMNFVIGFIGLVLALKPTQLNDDVSINPDGYIMAIFATLSFAVGIMAIRSVSLRVKNQQVVSHFAIITVLISSIMQVIAEINIKFSLYHVQMLALGGLFNTVQQTFMTRAFSLDRPTKLNILSYLTIVFGLIADKFYYKYNIDIYSYIGSSLIMITAVINYWKQQEPSGSYYDMSMNSMSSL